MHIQNIGSKSRAFINHKPFHPGNFKNVEAVWKVEEDKRQIEKQAKERAAIRAEEAKVEALKGQLRQFEAGGGTSKNQSIHGLDWMYENPADAARHTEEHAILLGKKEATPTTRDKIDKRHGSALGEAEAPDAELKTATGYEVTEDALRKMREDPLFVIKLADQKYSEKMLANPYTRAHMLSKEEAERREHLGRSSKGRVYLQVEDEIKELKDKVTREQMLIDDLIQKKRRNETVEHRRTRKKTSGMTKEEREKRLNEISQNALKHEAEMRSRAENHNKVLKEEEEREKERIMRRMMN
eukprot:GHVH01002104.1.p1 GENE.GHVH01002104.1~~GHVH01002104.1.p1  ORF type:complete len:298 (+),score=54.81 GHVH01002104.1:49-942(+)